MSTPPLFAPEFCDLLGGGQHTPAEGAYNFALDLDSIARRDAAWVLESGRLVRLTPIACAATGALVAFESEGVVGEISLAPDADGWVKIVATIGGRVVFTAYAEQVWEEYEFYPAGFPARPLGVNDDAPGRMGKRRSWISLSAVAWPQLAPLANEGGRVLAEPAPD